jgi:dTDP-glucose 4,6-dehydratase
LGASRALVPDQLCCPRRPDQSSTEADLPGTLSACVVARSVRIVYRPCARISPTQSEHAVCSFKGGADLLLTVYLKQFGFPLLSVRATNVYGARQQLFKIIPRSAIYLQTGRKIELHGGGRAVKSYIHIRDVSRGELAILERGTLGELYHLSPDEGVAVRDVVAMMCERLSQSFADSTTIVEERPGQDAAYVIDSTKARVELGWRPEVSLADGLNEVVDWSRTHLTEILQHSLQYEHRP